jgi:hypothetical protein
MLNANVLVSRSGWSPAWYHWRYYLSLRKAWLQARGLENGSTEEIMAAEYADLSKKGFFAISSVFQSARQRLHVLAL